MIETLFPDSVVVLRATEAMWDGALLPEEEAFVANAASKRRREFTAGRVCARAALARLGLREQPLPVGPDRAPLWPDGFTGSISHCDDLCAAAVAPRAEFAGIGLDVERADPLEPDVIRLVCSPGELRDAVRAASLPDGVAARLLFGAKEAVYKCCSPITRTWWEFQDVEIRLGPAAGQWTALILRHEPGLPRGLRSMTGRWNLDGRWILQGTSLPAAI